MQEWQIDKALQEVDQARSADWLLEWEDLDTGPVYAVESNSWEYPDPLHGGNF